VTDETREVPEWLSHAAGDRAGEWATWLELRHVDKLEASFPSGRGYVQVYDCAHAADQVVAGLTTLLGDADGSDPWGWDLSGYGLEVFRRNPMARKPVPPAEDGRCFLQLSWWVAAQG
jgi:hypothetical protein